MDHHLIQGDAVRLPFRDQSCDLVFGSPPYLSARLYLEDGRDLGIARDFESWVSWMLRVTEEALRVSRGAVVWVAAGSTRDRNYLPACEALMSDWFRRGGHAYRPCYWHRFGIPGSGGDQWFRADVEMIMCFKRPGKLPWSDNTALGHSPKWAPGGEMSHYDSRGKRRNQWGGTEKSNGHRKTDGTVDVFDRPPHVFVAKSHTKRKPNGEIKDQSYIPPVLANPGNLVFIKVGGGHLGSRLAHESEAPFPETLADFFIRSLCPPNGRVLDPFSGSGTTCAAAIKAGRVGIGLDLRRSQCDLGKRRIADGLRPLSKLDAGPSVAPAAGQMSLFGCET